ncbi:MAG: hypothetical protein MZV70_00135 [Desulfobacterales bacterium]|nr:hypothetical protein [Desulfobacterales bacterium]
MNQPASPTSGAKRTTNEDCVFVDDAIGASTSWRTAWAGTRPAKSPAALVVDLAARVPARRRTPGGRPARAWPTFSRAAGRLLAGIEWSNRVVHRGGRRPRADCRGMGSTVAAVYLARRHPGGGQRRRQPHLPRAQRRASTCCPCPTRCRPTSPASP